MKESFYIIIAISLGLIVSKSPIFTSSISKALVVISWTIYVLNYLIHKN